MARGIKIKMLLVDRAFFTVDCTNALDEMEIKFIMPCVANERVQSAIDTLGRTGKIDKFPIYNSERAEATFTMIVVRNDKGELKGVCHQHQRVEHPIFRQENPKRVSQEVVYRNDLSEDEGDSRDDNVSSSRAQTRLLHACNDSVQCVAGGKLLLCPSPSNVHRL
jgi:hypothetical protein